MCICVCLRTGILCMAQECSLMMPEDSVLPLLAGDELRDKYRRYLFRDYVEVRLKAHGLCGCVCPPVRSPQGGP